MNLDTYESGMASVLRVQPAYKATAAYTTRGRLTMETQFAPLFQASAISTAQDAAMPARSIAALTAQDAETEKTVIPDLDAEVLCVRYEMDKLSFDWKLNQGGFKFIPGDIKFTVTQRPVLRPTCSAEIPGAACRKG